MKNKFYVTAAFILALFSDAGKVSAQCNLICNGSFEAPAIAGSVGNINGANVPCWQTNATGNIFEFWSSTQAVPAHGNQCIEMNSSSIANVWQDFAVAPNSVLTIGFSHRGRLGTDTLRLEITPAGGGQVTVLGTYAAGSSAWVSHSNIFFNVPGNFGNQARLRFVSVYAHNNNTTGQFGNLIDNVTVTMPNPVINISASSPVICANVPQVLTASGAVSYAWSGPVTSQSNPLFLNSPVTPGTYNVIGTSVPGCSGSANITLGNGQVVMPTVSNATICNNASQCALLTAGSSYGGGPVTYNWSGNGISQASGQTANVCPTPLTSGAVYNYQVTASAAGACPGTAYATVTVTDNCCSQSTVGLTVPPQLSGNMTGTSYLINANMSVSGGVTSFVNCEFLMMPGVKIVVDSGEVLTIDHSHLYACGINMWQGIVVQDGGQVIIVPGRSNSTLIEDAMIGIDVDNITSAHASPPIDLSGAIFNKNYIGIRLGNSSGNITSLPVGISGCVFTSRNLPFTSTTWPLSNAVGGLRTAGSPTTDIQPPYPLQSFFSANIKAPFPAISGFANQVGHIGIKIENIGNVAGNVTAPGVQFGNNLVAADFNLFDGIGTGIDVTDASLTTENNVFQGMQYFQTNYAGWVGGTGIDARSTGLMNTRLDLRPSMANNQVPDFGNRFWNCRYGVRGENVYEAFIEQNLFRSSHNPQNGNILGYYGIALSSNRFLYKINYCEFNNINNSIWLNARMGVYDMGSGNMNGTYADDVEIRENYFGPEVASNINNPLPMGSEFSDNAVIFQGSINSSLLQTVGVCRMISNKLDRIYRGIRIDMMEDYPIEIGGNLIQVIEDYQIQPNQDQWAIYANDSKGNLAIKTNTVFGESIQGMPYNPAVKLIRSTRNISNSAIQSPVITCNLTFDAHTGFEFDDNNQNTEWINNEMNNHHIGLSLTNNAVIGAQGNSSSSSSNVWTGTWASPNWQTYCTNSDPVLSPLFVVAPYTTFLVLNGATGVPGVPYMTPASIDVAQSDITDCNFALYNPTPSQRIVSIGEIASSDWSVMVSPNPSNGKVTVSGPSEWVSLSVTITDLSGKVVFRSGTQTGAEYTCNVNSLSPGMYFISVESDHHQSVQKLIVQ